MSAVVEFVGISKTFPGVHALEDVSLTLRAGSIHALVGENGAGKSTLLNILSGIQLPDRGEIRVAGQPVRLSSARAARRLGIVAVHQEVDLFPDLTVAENVGLEQGLPTSRLGWINWHRQHERTRSALASIGETLSPSVPAGRLTPAQRQLVEIAAAVSQSARVLILDEPTSSLSAAETAALFAHLRRFRGQGTALVYVSHRLEEIFDLVDEVTVLRDGRRVWTGPIQDSSPRHLIGLMVGREVTTAARLVRTPGQVRLSCRDLTAADSSFHEVSLEVHAREVLGLYGLIGAGRSEWAQALFGLRGLAGGQVLLEQRPIQVRGPDAMVRAGLAYVPEDRLRQGLCRGLSVRANAVLATLRQWATLRLWVSRAREARQTRALIEQLAVRLRSIEQPVGTLSGGNQQKVVLGRWLSCEPRVLILDEPTRGVDIGAKAEIHALIQRLADQGRAIVLISSELPEVMAQSDRVGVFSEGRLIAIFDPRRATTEEIAAAAIPSGKRGRGPSLKEKVRVPFLAASLLREAALLGVLLLLALGMRWCTGEFLEAATVRSLLTDAALLSFCAIAAALVILAGGLDISLGAMMALSAGVAGRLWEWGQPLPIVIAAAIGLGAVAGLLNASLSLIGRVHPLVVTLGTMSVYRGLTLWWLAEDVQIAGVAREGIFADVLGLPLIVWTGLALVALAWLILARTVPGRELYALGSNPAAAHRVGIARWRVWLTAFTLQGMLAGLAGLLYLAQSGALQSTSYEDKTLEAIAAAVVGGVAITGGRGSVWGVALGCVFLVFLAPACILLHISTHWQRTLVGGVLVVAVLLDSLWRRTEA